MYTVLTDINSWCPYTRVTIIILSVTMLAAIKSLTRQTYVHSALYIVFKIFTVWALLKMLRLKIDCPPLLHKRDSNGFLST